VAAVTQGPDDRRSDHTTRDRYDELASSWDAAVRELDRRYKRVAVTAVSAVVIAFLAGALGFLLLQGQRWDATRDGCERTNRISEATISVLEDFKVRTAAIEIAKHRYPHVPPLIRPRGYSGPESCGEYANQQVGRPKL
jgi:hypothetical protein